MDTFSSTTISWPAKGRSTLKLPVEVFAILFDETYYKRWLTDMVCTTFEIHSLGVSVSATGSSRVVKYASFGHPIQ